MVVCKQNFNALAKNQIVIKSITLTSDGYGGFTDTEVTLGTFWSIITPKTVSEFVLNNSITSRAKTEMIIRYQTVLSNIKTATKHKIYFGTRIYNIEGVQNLDSFEGKNEGKAFQKLICTENEETV